MQHAVACDHEEGLGRVEAEGLDLKGSDAAGLPSAMRWLADSVFSATMERRCPSATARRFLLTAHDPTVITTTEHASRNANLRRMVAALRGSGGREPSAVSRWIQSASEPPSIRRIAMYQLPPSSPKA